MRNQAGLEQMEVDEVTAQDDAKYESMTDEERKGYYLKPTLMTRVKQAFGRQ